MSDTVTRPIPKAKVIKVLNAGGRMRMYPRRNEVVLLDKDGQRIGQVGTGTFVHLFQELFTSADCEAVGEIFIVR